MGLCLICEALCGFFSMLNDGHQVRSQNGLEELPMTSEKSLTMRNLLLLSAGVVLVMFAISGYVWTQVPAGEKVCTHWNAAGECDGYGSKFVGIFLLPIAAAGVMGLFTLIPRIEPRATHIAQSRKAYTAVWATMLLFCLALHIVLMLELLGYDANIGSYVPLLVGLMLVVTGSYLGKVQSNFFFGIRTPWTLSSELSWSKTHKLGGRLLILQGLLFMASVAIKKGEVWVYVLLGSSLVVVATLMIYSYLVWKGDTDVRSH